MAAVTASEVDARNLMCPLPVIRTQQRIDTLNDGDDLVVIATDPGVMHDVPAWCRVHGHRVTRAEQHDQEFHIHIRVCKP